VHVPLTFKTRGGYRIITDSIGPQRSQSRTDNALIKAIARAYRWRRQIEAGEYSSISELAKARNVNDSYACRVLRMTLLSPEIVTTILDGRQHSDLTLKQITRALPYEWSRQLKPLGIVRRA
jgi:hypothetical protein